MADVLFTRIIALVFGLTFVTTGAGAQRESAPGDTAVLAVDVSPKQGHLADLLKAEASRAIGMGRTPFVEIGAEWCGQCRELRANLGDKRMIDAFSGTYIVRLDYDAWKGELEPLGFNVSAIPVFFPLDTNGKAAGASFTTDPLGANTPEHVAAPLKDFFGKHLKKENAAGKG